MGGGGGGGGDEVIGVNTVVVDANKNWMMPYIL